MTDRPSAVSKLPPADIGNPPTVLDKPQPNLIKGTAVFSSFIVLSLIAATLLGVLFWWAFRPQPELDRENDGFGPFFALILLGPWLFLGVLINSVLALNLFLRRKRIDGTIRYPQNVVRGSAVALAICSLPLLSFRIPGIAPIAVLLLGVVMPALLRKGPEASNGT